MEPVRELVHGIEIDAGKVWYTLNLYHEDFSALYPGMIRYTVIVMAGEQMIAVLKEASLLVVCSPVYTNTVPGGLKLVIDRCQAYHAEQVLSGGRTGQKGLIFSVTGRKGEENFTCITRVISAFLRNLGIGPVGEKLVDRADAIRDIRTIPGMEQNVKIKVKQHLVIENNRKLKKSSKGL